MNLTIIRDDHLVTIDGRALTVDLSDLPADLHALQWYGNAGHVERAGLPNQPIDSLGDFQPWIDRWVMAAEAADHPPAIPLDILKSEKNIEINAARATANSTSFTHAGHAFSCDAISRGDIDGINGYIALYGSFPPQFPGVWKAVDNSYFPLADIAAWKDFYAAMVAAGAANFAHAQDLKQALAAATSPAEVGAIAWTNS